MKMITLALISGILILSGYLVIENSKSNEGVVTSGESKTMSEYLNIHSSGTRWLQVKNVKYKNVIGYDPYYLELPNTDFIFFIQSDDSGGQTAHFISKKSKKHYKFKNSEDYAFSHIGSSKPDYKVVIENSNMTEVTVLNVFEGVSSRFVFNFKSMTFIQK